MAIQINIAKIQATLADVAAEEARLRRKKKAIVDAVIDDDPELVKQIDEAVELRMEEFKQRITRISKEIQDERENT